MTSIKAASDTITVHGKVVKKNHSLLFMNIACYRIDPNGKYGTTFATRLVRRLPSLFCKSWMQKNTKSNLAKLVKGHFGSHYRSPTETYYILHGAHLLQAVSWPKEYTYEDVCNIWHFFTIAREFTPVIWLRWPQLVHQNWNDYHHADIRRSWHDWSVKTSLFPRSGSCRVVCS